MEACCCCSSPQVLVHMRCTDKLFHLCFMLINHAHLAVWYSVSFKKNPTSVFLMFHDGSNKAEGGCLSGIQRKKWAGIMKEVRTVLSCALRKKQSRGQCTLVCFHAQSSPAASCTSMRDWLGRKRRQEGERKRGTWEEMVLAVIRRYLAVTALVSLNSWGLSQLLMSRCVQPHVNTHTCTRARTFARAHILADSITHSFERVHTHKPCTHRCPLSARLGSAHSLWPQCCRQLQAKPNRQEAPTQDAKIMSLKSCT